MIISPKAGCGLFNNHKKRLTKYLPMDYIEFKNALREIGESEKAVEYFKLVTSIQSKLDKVLHRVRFEPENRTKRDLIYEWHFPEIDRRIELIRKQPISVRPILCRTILEYLKINFEEDDFPDFSKAGLHFAKNELNEIEMKAFHETTSQPADNQPESGKTSQGKKIKKLTQAQIALKSFYEGLLITRENAHEIARKNGHQSGQRLYQLFSFYSSLTNRKAKPDNLTKKTFQNKIELFESVIELLENPHKQRAIDELKILKTIFENEFE